MRNNLIHNTYILDLFSFLVMADATEENSITVNNKLLVSMVILSCGFSCQCIIIVTLCAVIITTKNSKLLDLLINNHDTLLCPTERNKR